MSIVIWKYIDTSTYNYIYIYLIDYWYCAFLQKTWNLPVPLGLSVQDFRTNYRAKSRGSLFPNMKLGEAGSFGCKMKQMVQKSHSKHWERHFRINVWNNSEHSWRHASLWWQDARSCLGVSPCSIQSSMTFFMTWACWHGWMETVGVPVNGWGSTVTVLDL